MYDSYSIIANFELDENWCSLTTSSTEGGSVTTPSEELSIHETGTVVNLVAESNNHYHFVVWTGNVSTVANVTAVETTITMNASYFITANFELEEGWYSLTVSSTEGGEVTTPPEMISVHAANTTVSIVAEPGEGYEFLRWTGNVSTIANVYAASTNITMYNTYSITAQFESWHPEPVALLDISSTRGGSVIEPGEGSFLYPLGAEVSLVAIPDGGSLFLNWSGDVDTIADVNDATTTITMDKPCAIRANFLGTGVCFITAAAYGTPMAEKIQILREFRNDYLLTNPGGRALVDFYYKVSPPIAQFITAHPILKLIVRAGLVPAIAISTIAINTTLTEKAAIIGLLVLVSVAVTIWVMRQQDRGSQYT
jgi:hypothetical protein